MMSGGRMQQTKIVNSRFASIQFDAIEISRYRERDEPASRRMRTGWLRVRRSAGRRPSSHAPLSQLTSRTPTTSTLGARRRRHHFSRQHPETSIVDDPLIGLAILIESIVSPNRPACPWISYHPDNVCIVMLATSVISIVLCMIVEMILTFDTK